MTCRFCHGWDKPHTIVRYGARHNAHLRCLKEKGRLEEVLTKMPTWSRNQLPALELIDLGMLDFVRSLAKSLPEVQ